MTFSIAAFDPDEQAWGIAVASKFLAAAAVVTWAQAGAGAVATQAHARVSFGANGLALLAEGVSANDTLARLLEEDPDQARRQVGIVDSEGGAAAHTGAECFPWAGHRTGSGFTCQGNILTGPETLDAMAETFMSERGELADRLVAALRAGDLAGGDSRGKQSAGVLVVRHNGGYGGDNDRYLDLRVDDDPEPVIRLQSLVAMHHLFFGKPRPENRIPITEPLARELQALMQTQGYWQQDVNGGWNEVAIIAFRALIGNENLEERWDERDPHAIDRVALEYLRDRFSRK